MSIVATEIESIHGSTGQQRMIFYRCQDSDGVWHGYGPVITIDDNYDPEEMKTTIAEIVAAQLAEEEAQRLLGD